MATGLESVDFEPLGRLLCRLAVAGGVLVLDTGGQTRWRGGEELPDLDTVLAARPRGAPVSQGACWRCNRLLVLERPLMDAAESRLGSLLYVTAGSGEDAEATATAIADCVMQIAQQASELDDMALELAGRYEELNLLYTLDERRAGYDPSSGEESLTQMVADCSVYLDVAVSCLHAPVEQLDLCVARDGAGDLRALWPPLRERMLALVAERNAAVVINTSEDWRALGLEDPAPGKLLLVPLRHADGQVCGLLCTLNCAEGVDYSNSDRRLMEVLGDQGSRIIQRSYDKVTGLLNRHGFERRAAHLLEREPARPVALLHLNLDSLRMVNDSAGRRAGDAMLARVAALLATYEPAGGLIGHLGGDEFVVLFASGEPLEQQRLHAMALQASLAADCFRFEGKRFDISACVGLAEGETGAGLAALASCAEAACRVAKGYGRGQLRVYDPADARFLDRQRQAAWGPRITEALGERQFVLFAQPIVPVEPRDHVAHYEVLVRLPQADGRMVAPGVFLSAAERYGLMPRLDRQVLAMTVEFMRRRVALAPDDDFVLAVNVSGQSLADGDYLAHALDAIAASGIPFRRLCFEVTETAAIADFDPAVRFIDAVRARGSRVALDDFGSGLSSFGYLRRLPVDYLKIDGQIVRAITEDPINAVMVDSIHRIGRVMGIATIAEFVENESVMQALRSIGVNFAQGYGIARPLPIEQAVPGGTESDAADPPAAVLGVR